MDWPTVFAKFLDKMYPWQIQVAGSVLIAGLVAFFIFSFYGANKFSKSISAVLKHNETTEKLWNELSDLRIENQSNKTTASYVSRVIYNIKPFIDSLSELRLNGDPQQRLIASSQLIQRLIDSLTTDIRYKSIEHHRCCLWGIDNHLLRPMVVSSGFPSTYSSTRYLERDNSIAGRAFRTKQTQNIPDVRLDREWVRNDESRSKYRSLICIPVGAAGVLTIDGIEPMSVECEQIGEVFASVILGAIIEYDMAIGDIDSYETEDFIDEEENLG